jgi:competence ComEA-like helix-hairpin-helix protein
MKISKMVSKAFLGLAILMLAVSTAGAAVKVNINTASKRLLQKLPGIGEDIAELIVKERRETGSFGSVSELKKIPGIGEKRIKMLEEYTTVGVFSNRSL